MSLPRWEFHNGSLIFRQRKTKTQKLAEKSSLGVEEDEALVQWRPRLTSVELGGLRGRHGPACPLD